MLEWSDFTAIPAEALAPTSSYQAIALSRTGPDAGLREHAAALGFKGVHSTTISYLARDLGLSAEGDALDIRCSCVSSVLKCSKADAWSTLDVANRADASGPLAVDDSVLLELLGEDKNVFQAAEKKAEDIKHRVRAVRKNILERKQTSAGASASASPGMYWRAKPKAAEWTENEVMQLLPPDAPVRCRRQPSQGRWYIEYKRTGCRSASWGIHGGESEAIRHVCREAWLLHERVTGTPCTGTMCPIKGLW